MELCAACGNELEAQQAIAAGSMLFHLDCRPQCEFCGTRYESGNAGWDFRGAVIWTGEWGYVNRLNTSYCPTCTDDGERRDYGLGW
ncbi:MAG: hypothetical protein U0821_05385 [Chloroflexota bacterium]